MTRSFWEVVCESDCIVLWLFVIYAYIHTHTLLGVVVSVIDLPPK
jgi:hypothetical protein